MQKFHRFTSSMSYLDATVFHPEQVRAQVHRLSQGRNFDTFVGRGMSGALVVPWIAREMGKAWAVVRKSGDGSHSSTNIEGEVGKQWVFLDDLIASGNTLHETALAIHTKLGLGSGYPEHETDLVGAITYYTGKWHDVKWNRTIQQVRGIFQAADSDG